VIRDHVGIWTGPGLLALVNGEWVHYLPRDAPRDLRQKATALVGTDRPRIGIRRVAKQPTRGGRGRPASLSQRKGRNGSKEGGNTDERKQRTSSPEKARMSDAQIPSTLARTEPR
jgi:hypothetical protein